MAMGGSYGLQAGLVNIGGGGVQVGLVNISQNEKVVPIGLVNIVKGGMKHPAIYYDDMNFINIGFYSGSQRFYSIVSVGGNLPAIGGKDEDKLLVFRFGVGTEFSFGKRVFLDFDITAGTMLNVDTLDTAGFNFNDDLASLIAQARLSAGFKVFEHLGIFGGLSYDYIHRESDASPDSQGPEGFVFGWSTERNIHKLGIFGGVRF
jgi:hypothetical protein